MLKSNNKIRLCEDFEVLPNIILEADEHPLPTTDELFSNMEGGTSFSKIYSQNAYLQLEVSPEDRVTHSQYTKRLISMY